MKISTMLDHIDSGHIALPEFQRGYVWNRDQVRSFFDSLYKRHPVGSLLVWVTESQNAEYRGKGSLAQGVVKLLLDGQQRITSLYGVVRGEKPKFFEGNEKALFGLRFHLEKEEFAFYSPIKMDEDPLWIDITALLKEGHSALGKFLESLGSNPKYTANVGKYAGRLSNIIGITDIDLYVEEVTGKDKSIEIVVDIFNRVNSGGTKLSQGDLALAKICAEWPDAREKMKTALQTWIDDGYQFDLDWLLRNVNTILTGEAKFLYLHNVEKEKVVTGLDKAIKAINYMLNLISGRLGLDHDRVFFGRYALPVMVHYYDKKGGILDEIEQDKLIFWYVQAAMWGRFSGSTESFIDKDLNVIEDKNGALDRLIEQLRLWHGGLNAEAGHFEGWSMGARFYPVLYMLTRVGEAKDWGTGLPLKQGLLGKKNKLEVHHIFPKAVLYQHDYSKSQVNAIANFCFQTGHTNLKIGKREPREYFVEIESKHPGALASQWIPMDENLWQIANYLDFLEERKRILAKSTNNFMTNLLHSDLSALGMAPVFEMQESAEVEQVSDVVGSIDSEEEEQELLQLNEWIQDQGLPAGNISHELSDPEKGYPIAVFDVAWPNGLQKGLSQPVAVLLNEGPAVYACANRLGFKYFTEVDAFKDYVLTEILAVAD
jgi:hypothetical protein